MNKLFFLLLFLGSLAGWSASAQVVTERSYGMPVEVEGKTVSALSLNGTWDFKFSTKSHWSDIQVPGEVAMQGYAIEHDKPFFYRKKLVVPSNYEGKRIVLRFDGVYSQAKLSINGKYVREHRGGFTRWETDVTPWIRVGKKNTIELEVVDRLDEISYAAGYAHHPVGGILRDVTLYALPEAHLYDVNVTTDFDESYQDAVMRFACGYAGKGNGEVVLGLKDREGKNVSLQQSRFSLKEGMNEFSLPVEKPIKWDAEHPNLYELTVTVSESGKETCRYMRKIGFREVKVEENRLLVNGMPVKLRGACRHDIHPTLGRMTTAELDSIDALMFKQANMNFVRTSHYPPSERFLEFCDRYGIYVECETAVCFVNTFRSKNYKPGSSENNPDFTAQYLSQCQEMVKTFAPHPSIIIWSLGNESRYGENFRKEWEWVKQNDPSRPAVFSWPGTVKGDKIFDILTMHYPGVAGNIKQHGAAVQGFDNRDMPVLFDEWAHPACYTYATLQMDPNIREFWGRSLDMMWGKLFNVAGGLGGAIWGYVDETFALPQPKVGTPYWKEFAHTAKPWDYAGSCVGYGEWGIVDVWRRPKPEFWSTKKAYSPVKLLASDCLDFVPGQEITLTVHNRFDHTYLNEIRARYIYKGVSRSIELDAVMPHAKGVIRLPAEQWEEGEKVLLEFATAENQPIDTYCFTLGKERVDYPALLSGEKLTVTDKDGKLTIAGKGFEIPFDKNTGLIDHAIVGGKVLIEKGPFLNLEVNLNHLSGAEVRKQAKHILVSEEDWKLASFRYDRKDEEVSIYVSGTYGKANVDFHIRITPQGTMSISYWTKGFPNGYLRESGVSFHLSDELQHLQWKRRGYWNYYPEGEFAGNEGETWLYRSRQAAYGQQPVQPWQADTHEYYYWADAGAASQKPLTRMAKGMKENVFYYTLSTDTVNGRQMSIVSQQADVACRMNKLGDEQLRLYVNNRWDYPEIAWGNYCKKQEAQPCYGEVELRLK